MEAVTVLPFSRSLTRADLEQMPEDGHRYELIDGTLIVSPAPLIRHQRIVLRLALTLEQICPAGYVVLAAPTAVALADDTEIQPDVLVAHEADLTEKDLPAAPALAVEVLSPSTKLIDLNLKKARLEQAGCVSYWVIDPTDDTLIAWELRDGAYVEVARVTGDETWTATLPFPVQITPSALR